MTSTRARRLSGHGHRAQGACPARSICGTFPARGRLEADFAQLLDLELTEDKGFPPGHADFWGAEF